MRHATIFALATLCLTVLPLPGWSQASFPGPNDGYTITKTESNPPVPEGFEGKTDIMSETAVGNTPATAGKSYVMHMTFSNQIKICPDADGTAEGQGVSSLSLDGTNGTTSGQIEMVANAKYKGQVGDDAWLQGPVIADINYSYTQSGTFPGQNGAIASPAGGTSAQHITIPFAVGINGDLMPKFDFGAMTGGDPLDASYSKATAVGLALAYWAGVFYATAEIEWRDKNRCVRVGFNPPSKTLKLVPGGEMTVNAEVKTLAGERVKALYPDVHAFSGSVSAPEAYSDVGQPMKVTYIAPDHTPSGTSTKPGFEAAATSRAGVAADNWEAGLGTGWSGEITCTKEVSGDQGSNDLQTWAGSSTTRITISVTDGKGTASGYSQMKYMQRTKQPALIGNVRTFINATSDDTDGSLSDTSPVDIEVNVDKVHGTYSIQGGFLFKKEGKQHTMSCVREKCQPSDSTMYIEPILKTMQGKLDDPNHLHGTMSEQTTGVGFIHNGKIDWNMTWNLARQGASQ